MSTQRITWKRATYAGWRGYLDLGADVRVAGVHWGTMRDDDKPWKLRVNLPGSTSKEWSFANADDAKDQAERVLLAFISMARNSVAKETSE